jgi:hypothetical protein
MLPPHELINLIIQVLDHEIAQTRILFLAELREILFSTRAKKKRTFRENYRKLQNIKTYIKCRCT